MHWGIRGIIVKINMAVDRIKEMQRIAAEDEVRAEAIRKQAEAVRVAADVERERQMQRETSERKAREARELEERRGLVNRLLEESGVLRELKDIELNLLRGIEKHGIILDIYTPSVTLVWGSRFEIHDNEIGFGHHFWSPEGLLGFLHREMIEDYSLDYTYIRTNLNLETQAIRINEGKEIPKSQWSTNRALVSEELAQAYLHPKRHTYEKPSSDTGTATECCCQ